jgi:anhydro-N-acetylmuramic acid kinase
MDFQEASTMTGIGVMSGTSLDGLDLIAARFRDDHFEILAFSALPFDDHLREALKYCFNGSALHLVETEHSYSNTIARAINRFAEAFGIHADFAAIHGQTIFHRPEKGISHQLLDGGRVAALTGMPVVCDFRRKDIAMGGQGAPLVPLGDEILFSTYEACLNLGGFANISYRKKGIRKAFDIGPVNILLNLLAQRVGQDYDEDGALARSGQIDHRLLEELNSLPYYQLPPPKSLGWEWVHENIESLLDSGSPKDLLATLTEHAAIQISRHIPVDGDTLVTGGGAYNSFLIERINHWAKGRLIVPEKDLIEGKEALIFAYLGYLRLHRRNNIYASVTGSSADHCSGAIYLP